MLTSYDLVLPRRVVFGWGRRRELPAMLPADVRFVLAVVSPTVLKTSSWSELLGNLQTRHTNVLVWPTPAGEPTVDSVDGLLAEFRQLGACPQDVLLAVGGGSTLDTVKALAGLVACAPCTSGEHGDRTEMVSTADYLEGVGRGLTLDAEPLRWVAVPTTAGTGSEATKNAVISSTAPPFKKSLRDERLMASAVLIDPELTCSVPPAVTAATGMDAITQLLESLITRKSTPVTRALCLTGLQSAWPALPIAVANRADRAAREAMSQAAFLSGVTLANAGLGLAHGVAAALGAHCGLTHGVACAMLLPWALRYNAGVSEPLLAAVAQQLLPHAATDAPTAVEQLIQSVCELNTRVGIPARLREVSVPRDLLATLAVASQGNSLNGNPRSVSSQDLQQLLEQAW